MAFGFSPMWSLVIAGIAALLLLNSLDAEALRAKQAEQQRLLEQQKKQREAQLAAGRQRKPILPAELATGREPWRDHRPPRGRALDPDRLRARQRVARGYDPAAKRVRARFVRSRVQRWCLSDTVPCKQLGRTGSVYEQNQQATTRQCPYCKEEIRADATLCKHCRADLGSSPPSMGSGPAKQPNPAAH